MNYKFQYQNDAQRNDLIARNSDKFLIEEQNIIEGNFLVFTDEAPIIETVIVYEQVKNEELMQLQQDNLILMDALAMTFEEVMMLRMEMGGTA